MGFSKKTSTFLTALLAATAQGHMIMRTPIPLGKSTLNNSPLDPSGSDFPCKQRTGVYDKEGAENVMAIGESQTLSFTGSAVHGGGSCQVALTTDLAPTKDSKWMVIKSIIGGCPANVAGNLPADPNGTGASTFQYTIPASIAPGEYVLSWSWANKIGNREYYENCAAITVTSPKRRRWESEEHHKALQALSEKRSADLPGKLVVNLASINDCKSPENFEVAFANPGNDAQTAGQGPYTTLGSECEVGGGGGGGAPTQPTSAPANPPPGGQPTYSGSAPGGQATGQPAGNPGYQGKPSDSSVAPTVSAGNFANGAASSSPAVNGVVTPVTTSIVPAETSAVPAADSREGGNNTGVSVQGQSGACTEGAWSCSADGTSFQRCASGSWSTTIAMAAGMKCVPGISANFQQSAGKAKRHTHGGHFRVFDSFH